MGSRFHYKRLSRVVHTCLAEIDPLRSLVGWPGNYGIVALTVIQHFDGTPR